MGLVFLSSTGWLRSIHRKSRQSVFPRLPIQAPASPQNTLIDILRIMFAQMPKQFML